MQIFEQIILGIYKHSFNTQIQTLIWLLSSESSSRKKVELKFLTDIVCRLCSSRTTEKKMEGRREGGLEERKGRKEEGTEGGKEKRRIGHVS